MAWTLDGDVVKSCGCKTVCRCTFGPAALDRGWCSGVPAFAVEPGASSGVDLGVGGWPRTPSCPATSGGIDKAVIYLDEASSEEQREELEAIFSGQRGGVWEGASGMIAEFLPPKTVPDEIGGGDKPRVNVGDVIELSLERMKTEAGQQTMLASAPLSAEFAVDTLELATATGAASDPDLRSWETLGYGAAVRLTGRSDVVSGPS